MNQFSRPPPPGTEAWRMTVEFSRVSGFRAEEVHTVGSIPVPPAGQSWNAATNVFGPYLLEMSWRRRPEDGSPVGFWATVRPVRNDHKLTLLRATDNLGRAVPFKNSGGGASVTHEDLTLPFDATSVNLEFALHASRVITFQVKPEVYQPARTNSQQ